MGDGSGKGSSLETTSPSSKLQAAFAGTPVLPREGHGLKLGGWPVAMELTDQQVEGTPALDAAGSSLGKRDSEGGAEQPVMKKSRAESGDAEAPRDVPDDEDPDLARAIQLSLEGTTAQDSRTAPFPDRQRSTNTTASAVSKELEEMAPATAAAASSASRASGGGMPASGASDAGASAAAGVAPATSEDGDSFTCPVCWDPVACAARPPCGHMLCRVCAQQLLRDGGARCPQCRAEVAEAELQGSPTADAAALELAKRTLDVDAFAEWEQRLADGKALDARATTGAAASSGDDQQTNATICAELRFLASAAPTSSGKCKVCAQKIARHDLRIHAHGGGFTHLGCMDFAAGLTAARDHAREKAGVPGAEVILNVVTTPEFHGPCRLSEEQLDALKQKLREPAGNQPWWCVVRHKGPLWADEDDELDGLLSEDDMDDSDSDSNSDDDDLHDDDDDDDDDDDRHHHHHDVPSGAFMARLNSGGNPVRISTSLTVSAAPTDRARCVHCGEAIPRGSPRLHESTGAGFRHWHCRDFQTEWTSACSAARPGDDDTVSLEVRSNVDPTGIGTLDRQGVQLLKQILRESTELLPDWVWVRHRGTLWSSSNGTPRPAAGNLERLLSGDAGNIDADNDQGNGAAALGPGARALLREAMGAAAASRPHAGSGRTTSAGNRNTHSAGGSFEDYISDDHSDADSADEEDSSDEAAIAQAGHLGAALGGVLSLMPGAREEDGHGQDEEPEPWAKVSLSYITSAAPSDRGKCKACGQAIAQGSLVVAERLGGGHCHFGCKDFVKEVTDACLQARAGPCQECFLARPVGANEDISPAEAERQVALTIAVDIESRSDRFSVRVPFEARIASSMSLTISHLRVLCSAVLAPTSSSCTTKLRWHAGLWKRRQIGSLGGSGPRTYVARFGRAPLLGRTSTWTTIRTRTTTRTVILPVARKRTVKTATATSALQPGCFNSGFARPRNVDLSIKRGFWRLCSSRSAFRCACQARITPTL